VGSDGSLRARDQLSNLLTRNGSGSMEEKGRGCGATTFQILFEQSGGANFAKRQSHKRRKKHAQLADAILSNCRSSAQ
jgi:hypothetical protein